MSLAARFALHDQVAVVTGGGRGIGAAVAVALAEAGADVVICARTRADLDVVASEVEAAGRRARVVVADLSDLDAAPAVVAAAVEEFGRLDVVVNNLGAEQPAPFLETSTDDLARAFGSNVLTAHALTTAAVPAMLEHDGGAVVNIASAIGHTVGRGYLAYGTAKAALLHYTRLAAEDLAPRIRVNAVSPGPTLTPALESFMRDDGFRTALEHGTPLRRIGRPEEVAAAVVFLASAASGYLTGANLPVSGGQQRAVSDLPVPDL